jgi:hypothetical protein
MFTIKEFRALLPEPQKSNFTDAEVKRIIDIGYGFADAIFDKWLEERNKEKEVLVK